MRKLLLILIVVLVIAAAIAAYLVATTPAAGESVRYPLSDRNLDLMMRVPASADAFALIPTAPQLHTKLKTNPVTRDVVEQWATENRLPSAWLLGGADIVIWKKDKKTGYAIRVDSLRAVLLRISLFATNLSARWDGTVFIVNAQDERTLTRSELEPLTRLAAKLPTGDVFVVQRESSRGAFPPTSRPVVSSVRVTSKEIEIVSRARAGIAAERAAIQARHPKSALLSVSFVNPPRLLDDVKRLLRADIGRLVSDGGSIVLYDIDAGTLLPRPDGVIVVPATDDRRAALGDVRRVADLVGETRDTGRELLVSFDRKSVGLYLKDAPEPATWPATRWSLRLDPVRLIPILERLGDNAALRFAARRMYQSTRDLRRWIGNLQNAEVIEAADSAQDGVEELRVRIASK